VSRNAVTFAVVAAALCAVPFAAPGYKTSLATEMLIFAALAMSIDVLAGYAGRTSLGHGAIFGIATYVVLYTVTVAGGHPWMGAVLGLCAATVAAVVFALLAIRTSGVYFLLITLALGMIVWGICLRWTSVTGGEKAVKKTQKSGATTKGSHEILWRSYVYSVWADAFPGMYSVKVASY